MSKSQYQVLVVDDSREDREAYYRLMTPTEGDEYVIWEAETTQEAMKLFRSNPFDCVLLDYKLPDGDGIEFLERLAVETDGSTLPVIMLTGRGDESVAVRAMKAGAQDYLVKDQLNRDGLCRAIQAVMEKVRLLRTIERQRAQLERLTGPMQARLDCYGMTHPGKQREVNEDQFLIADLHKSLQVRQASLGLDEHTRLFGPAQGTLLLVADGISTLSGGKRASSLAVESVANYVLNSMRWFFRMEELDWVKFEEELKSSLEHCQAAVRREGKQLPEARKMGTTLTMAYIMWPRLFVVHAGANRCYLLRNSALQLLTSDHTLGQLTNVGQEPGPPSAQNRALWNFIGAPSGWLSPEVYKSELALGDTLLLCSDGVTREISEERIAMCLSSNQPAERMCRQLTDEANEAGGSDNITAVVGRFLHVNDAAGADSR